ncbi:MAG: hypothetical protein IVW57_03165 [Ktedonobacterales bacterium]|nr:hypothetical protein [Ktedonobacterales bacterium]
MARCKVCHRALTNADHIRDGMGPVCAAKAAARASSASGHQHAAAQAGYPVARYEAIVRGAMACSELLERAETSYRLLLDDWTATDAELAELRRIIALRIHWCQRVERMKVAAYRRLAPVARTFAAA